MAVVTLLARLDDAAAGLHDRFLGPELDTRRWVDHYLPHWTTPERSAARYDLGATGAAGGLRLRIDADQADWRVEDSGGICVCEIDAEAIGSSSTRARVGVKAHHDPRLTDDMTEVVVPHAADQPHTWSVRWDGRGVVVACESEVVFSSPQVLDYPLQLMVDLFELRRETGDRYPKTALVHEVTGT